jgi:hypothetical protein
MIRVLNLNLMMKISISKTLVHLNNLMHLSFQKYFIDLITAEASRYIYKVVQI